MSTTALGAGALYHRDVSFDRIAVNPEVMGGVATVRGLRIPVATVVAMVADGMSVDEIVADLPDLTAEDVREAIRYAAALTRERHVALHAVA